VSAPPKEMSFSANAVLSAFAWFVPALTALIAVPITVRGLGADGYGLLAIVTAVTGYLGLMEMGLGTAIVRYLSYYRALNQGRPMLGLMRFAVEWFGGAGVVGGVVLFLGAHWIVFSLLKIPADMTDTAITVVRITAFGFAAGMLVSVGTAVPQSFLRYDVAAVINIVFGVAGSAGPAILVLLGFQLVAVVAYGVLTDVIAVGVYLWIAVRLFKPIDKEAGPSWLSIRRAVLKFAAVTALTKIHSVISSQTSRVVVGAASGVAAAAYYQVPSMLASRVNSMLSTVAQVVFPTASGMKARNDEEGVKTLYLRTSRLFFVVNGSVTMAMCALAYPLLQYWVSPKYAEEGAVALVVFSITSAINATTMSASYVNLSAARPGTNLMFSFSNSVITLATVYPLTVTWGVVGAALAGLLGASTVPAFFWYAHRKIIHLSSFRVLRQCYLPTMLGAGLVGVAAYILVAPRLHNLPQALAAFAMLTLVGMAVSGLCGAIKREDIATAVALVRRSRPRRKVKPPVGEEGAGGAA
jgi:O-antigen/teichoic acid export membrane protein